MSGSLRSRAGAYNIERRERRGRVDEDEPQGLDGKLRERVDEHEPRPDGKSRVGRLSYIIIIDLYVAGPNQLG